MKIVCTIKMSELHEDDQMFFFGIFLYLSNVIKLQKQEIIRMSTVLFWLFMDFRIADHSLFIESTFQVVNNGKCFWSTSRPDPENYDMPTNTVIAIMKLSTIEKNKLLESFSDNIDTFISEYSFQKTGWFVNSMIIDFAQMHLRLYLTDYLNKYGFEKFEKNMSDFKKQNFQHVYFAHEDGMKISISNDTSGLLEYSEHDEDEHSQWLVNVKCGKNVTVCFQEIFSLAQKFRFLQ